MNRVFPVTMLPGDKYRRIKRKEPQVRFISMVKHEDIYDVPAALRGSQATISSGQPTKAIEVKDTRPSNNEIEVSPYWISNDSTINSAQNLVIPPTPTKPAKIQERDTWSNRVEFILSCVGLSAGIGNVWRFPYLAYQNGGAAFLFAYIALLIFVGKPMYFMELAWGQFVQSGPVGAFSCTMLWKGVGYAMFVISVIVSVYYNVIVAYCLLYLSNSFYNKLPWDGCDQWWLENNSTCYDRSAGLRRCSELTDVLTERTLEDNDTLTRTVWVFQPDNCTNSTIQTSAQLFWERHVLNISSGIEEVGEIKYDLLICLAVAWLICFCCIAKGIKTSGKAVYFTSTFPYAILICLLIRGVTLEGAVDGLRYFFIPEWRKLLNLGVWQKAAEQLFFSLSVSMGSLFVYGSFNKSGKNIAKDATLVSYVDFLTSLLASIVIFSVLGNMSYELGIPIDKVAQQGQGLAFVTYPEALSRLWVPQLWSFLFFFMLFLLGLDSEFAGLEVIIVTITDKLPSTRKYKVVVAFVTCVSCFSLGILCVLNNGQYTLNLLDTYGGGVSIIFVSFFEMAALMWCYGFQNFSDDLKMTLGVRPSMFWQICWAFIAPLVLLFVCGWSLYDTSGLKYGDYEYPFYGKIIGWFLVVCSVGVIPLFAFIEIYKHRKNPKSVFQPDKTFADHRLKMISKEASNANQLFELHLDEKGMDYDGSDYSLEDSFEDASDGLNITGGEVNSPNGDCDSGQYSVITLRS